MEIHVEVGSNLLRSIDRCVGLIDDKDVKRIGICVLCVDHAFYLARSRATSTPGTSVYT